MNHHKPLPNDAVIETEHFHPLTWRQRWQILFGCNLKTTVTTRIWKRQGKADQDCKLEITKHATAEDMQRTNAIEGKN